MCVCVCVRDLWWLLLWMTWCSIDVFRNIDIIITSWGLYFGDGPMVKHGSMLHVCCIVLRACAHACVALRLRGLGATEAPYAWKSSAAISEP